MGCREVEKEKRFRRDVIEYKNSLKEIRLSDNWEKYKPLGIPSDSSERECLVLIIFRIKFICI